MLGVVFFFFLLPNFLFFFLSFLNVLTFKRKIKREREGGVSWGSLPPSLLHGGQPLAIQINRSLKSFVGAVGGPQELVAAEPHLRRDEVR